MRVLVAEDHERLAHAVAAGLRDEGMAVDVVLDGQDALDHVALTRYDVLVLDRDLPGVHGDEVCRALAAGRCPTRVLMLTAASTVAERVDGLGLDADDCPRRSRSATCLWTRPGTSRSGPGVA
jgi:DNA-binding response OmpR family regulator